MQSGMSLVRSFVYRILSVAARALLSDDGWTCAVRTEHVHSAPGVLMTGLHNVIAESL